MLINSAFNSMKSDDRLLLVVSCLLLGPNNRQLTTNNSMCIGIWTIARISMHLHIKISLHIFRNIERMNY